MSKYKETLNLPKTSFPMKSSPQAEVTRLMSRSDISDDYPSGGDENFNRYILHDGPPFANGDIHLGHVLNKVLKDIDMRFRQLIGKDIYFRPGWDCHGLPIENKVKAERPLMLIDDRGASLTYNPKYYCEQEAAKWVNEQKQQFRRLAINGDWDSPYLTMAPGYEHCVLNIWKKLVEKGLTYKEKRPVHWSVESQTALALAELEYKNITQTSVYVKMWSSDLQSNLLIWTTTPWSLPSNVAIAVNPNMEYCEVAIPTKDPENDEYFIVAKDAVERLFKQPYRITKTFKGDFLEEYEYDGLFDRSGIIINADFVTPDIGTGLVHLAPAHGVDDFQACKKANIEFYSALETNCLYNSTTPEFLRGKHIWEGEKLVLTELEARGKIFRSEDFNHDYPHDWRSGKPVITLATEQIYIALDKPFDNGPSLRTRAINALKGVEFIAASKEPITKLLQDRPDWCVSRQRVWGINIPGETHIFDVWFESGCSWSQVPGPADTYLEGVDQYRGWFQHSLLLSVAVNGVAPFKRVVAHGFIVGPNGEKLSKSDPNYVAATEIISAIGSEPIRLWVASNDFRKDITSSPVILREFVDKYNKIRNTLKYLISNLYDYDSKIVPATTECLDGWARYEIAKLKAAVFDAYFLYEYHKVYQLVSNFCSHTLSAIYANAMKDRLYCDRPDSERRRRCQTTMMYAYTVLCELLTPILPLLVEECKEYLTGFNNDQLTGFYECGKKPSDTWPVLFELREQALSALEFAKKHANLNKAVDAEIVYKLKDHQKYLPYGDDLADFLGCGYHSLEEGHNSVAIIDRRNDWQACERSWKRRPDVKDGLSARDADAVNYCFSSAIPQVS